jgi:hypothetical protein
MLLLIKVVVVLNARREKKRKKDCGVMNLFLLQIVLWRDCDG